MAALAHPAPTILPPQGTSNLRALDKEVRQHARNLKIATMNIAHFGFRLREEISEKHEGNWGVLGFYSEDLYRESLGIGRSTWFKAVRIGEALSQLSLEDMQEISVGMAELLIQVDPLIMGDYPWIREAKNLSMAEFAEKISQRHHQHKIEKEPTAQFSVKVSVTAKRFLEETVEKFRVEHELASTAEALELLIADVHDRPNAMATMKAVNTLIEWAMGRMKKKHVESREYQWLYRATMMLSRTYSAVRLERPDEEDAQEIYPAESPYERPGRPAATGILSTKRLGSDGTPPPRGSSVEEPSRYLHPLWAEDELDGSEHDVENGEQG